MTQNFDVLIVLSTFAVAVYYGIVKPSIEVAMKDRKVSGERQEAKGNREVKVVIDNISQTEITLKLTDKELQDESIVLTRALQELTTGGKK